MPKKTDRHWPPPYQVKENARAKRVIFRIRPDIGLVITVPRGFNRRTIPKILDENRQWIEANLLKRERENRSITPEAILPGSIYLASIDQTWRVHYHRLSSSGIVKLLWKAEPTPQIDFFGDFSNVWICCRLLGDWLKDMARATLVSWTHEMMEKTGYRCRRIQVRLQKTRWASYSSRGTLSLNAILMFVPEELVRYVITHELCHSVYPNHGSDYWDLVAKWEPKYRQYEDQLASAGEHIPVWVAATHV